jgi:signal transduction histidine kinase
VVLQGKIEAATQNLIDKLAWVLSLCFLLAIGTAVGTLRIIQKGFSQLESQSSELAHVSWHMLEMQEKLARQFSHEMHDELGQSLSGLRRLLSGVPEGQFGAIRSECVGICDEVIQGVRKLSQVLRPVILDDFGLDPSLRWLCDRFNQRTRIEIEYVSNFNGRLSESMETHFFRITQEALTNIARHSQATAVCVSLAANRNSIRLTIDDNGRGLEARVVEPAPGLGMVGMKARARQIHGELRVMNRKEGGVRLEVEAPLQEAAADVEREDPSFVG